MNTFLLILLVGIATIIFYEVGRLLYFARQARILAQRTKLSDYHHPSHVATVLVMGDSVGCGTGASHPDHSIAGQLARRFHGIHLSNRSTVGGVGLRGILEPLTRENGTYDLVILFVGGLDIIQFTDKREYAKLLEDIYREAGRLGTRVAHVSPANVRLAPIFRPPLTWIYERRSREFRDIAQKVAKVHQVHYVDMFYEKEHDPFGQKDEYYAEDRSHPSDKGYHIWTDKIAGELEHLLHGNS